MKNLVPDFTSKEFWTNLLIGIITISLMWWFGLIQWSFELGGKFARWFWNLF